MNDKKAANILHNSVTVIVIVITYQQFLLIIETIINKNTSISFS